MNMPRRKNRVNRPRTAGGRITSAAVILISIAVPSLWPQERTSMSAGKSGYAHVNGLSLYYEIHGSGIPLIVLHGGLGSTEMFADMLPSLAKTRQVIAADLQAHGRTADIDRPLSIEAMADDIAGLVRELRIERADVLGYSLGGGVALQMAIRHPDRVRRLVLISTPFARNGWFPEVLTAMSQMRPASAELMKPSPIYRAYARSAPRPQDWPVLVGKVGNLTRKDYDWSKHVAVITSPTLIVFGDADAVRPEHMTEFFHLLGGGKKDGGLDGSGRSNARLAILPGMTHYDILSSPVLGAIITGFLDAQMR